MTRVRNSKDPENLFNVKVYPNKIYRFNKIQS